MKNKNLQNPTLNKLEFIPTDELPDEIVDAEASLMLNPYVRWAKFIFTDDQPNGNNERTPLSEFDNLIQSGIHMPIKMAEGRVEDGHEDATPIGVITHLTKTTAEMAGKIINQIIGLAAFWLKERPSDVTYLKERIDSGQDVNLSWEIGAQEKIIAPDGVFDWTGTAVQAVTVVDRPAYLGRTRIVAMAAKKPNEKKPSVLEKWGKEYIENLPNSNFLYVGRDGQRLFPVKDDKGLFDEGKLRESLEEMGKSNLPTPVLKSLKRTATTLLERIDGGASLEEISIGESAIPLENNFTEDDTVELEELKRRVAELEAKLAAAEASLQEKETARASLETEKTEMQTKLAELQAFKDEIDAEVAKVEKLDGIKAKFAEAKLTKDEAWFTENEEKLLKTDEASLDFMIQEFVSFSAQASLKDDENGDGKVKIPNFINENGEIDIHEIVKALKERKGSK